jgi:hypothetical protein
MAFNNSFTAVVGATYTAAQYNTHVRDNLTAIWVYTTAGDIVYASSATTLARLGKPSVDSVLKNTSAGVPEWLAMTAIPGRLHTYGTAFSDSLQTTTSTSYAAIGTGLKFNMTLGVACFILALASGRGGKNSGSHLGYFGLSIDGTHDPNSSAQVISPTGETFMCLYYRSGIAAGTRTVELKYKTENASDSTGFNIGRVTALAFAE